MKMKFSLLLMLLASIQASCMETNSGTTNRDGTGSKAHIEKQGFQFVKEIPAPEGMNGWAGYTGQNPATVFIS